MEEVHKIVTPPCRLTMAFLRFFGGSIYSDFSVISHQGKAMAVYPDKSVAIAKIGANQVVKMNLSWQWLLLLQASPIQWSSNQMVDTCKTCRICGICGRSRQCKQPQPITQLCRPVLFIFANPTQWVPSQSDLKAIIHATEMKKAKLKKSKTWRERVQGSEGFYSGVGAWGRLLTRGYPCSTVPSS